MASERLYDVKPWFFSFSHVRAAAAALPPSAPRSHPGGLAYQGTIAPRRPVLKGNPMVQRSMGLWGSPRRSGALSPPACPEEPHAARAQNRMPHGRPPA